MFDLEWALHILRSSCKISMKTAQHYGHNIGTCYQYVMLQ